MEDVESTNSWDSDFPFLGLQGLLCLGGRLEMCLFSNFNFLLFSFEKEDVLNEPDGER